MKNFDFILNAVENGGGCHNPALQVWHGQMASWKDESREDKLGVGIVLMDGGDGLAWGSEHQPLYNFPTYNQNQSVAPFAYSQSRKQCVHMPAYSEPAW